MIMRYQSISPEPDSAAVSLSSRNGRRTNSSWKTSTFKEDDDDGHNIDDAAEINGSFDAIAASRTNPSFRSPSKTLKEDNLTLGNGRLPVAQVPDSTPTSMNHHVQSLESNGGDMLLQWGHRKRSRCSRGIMAATDDSSSSSSTQLQSIKLQKRAATATHQSPSRNPNPNASTMPPPPPPPPPSNGIGGRGTNSKSPVKSTASPVRQQMSLEVDRSGDKSPPSNSTVRGGSSSRSRVRKRTPPLDRKRDKRHPPSEQQQLNTGCSSVRQQRKAADIQLASCDDYSNNIHHVNVNDEDNSNVAHDEVGKMTIGSRKAAAAAALGGEKGNGGSAAAAATAPTHHEWPRIYIPLSRKEKEEDFLAMKGTKLPHRPKKRPKTIDRILQACKILSGKHYFYVDGSIVSPACGFLT